MRATFVLRAVLLPTLWLTNLVASESDSQFGGAIPAVPTPDTIEGDWRVDCPPDISVCGKTTNVEVVHHHNETIYTTQNHTKTTTKTMSPHTRVITSISVVTVKNQTEGLCRDTSTIYEAEPLTVTVDVNITTTREFVPIVNSTLVVISEVTAAALQQCFIKQTSLASAAASATSATAAPSVAAASAESSGDEATTTQSGVISDSFAAARESDDSDDEDETTSEATSYTYTQNPFGTV
ncbi:hypothetical protein ACKRZS_013881 [Fusarium odoratissimum]